jgi:tRNA (guanine-N7-)-methyltransferase
MRRVGGLIEKLKRGEEVANRHENPYVHEAALFDGVLFTPDEIIPRFPMVFDDNTKPVVMEIGSYLGKNLIEMATLVPAVNVLGLEITYKRAVKCARKIKNNDLKNARVSICDARVLLPEIPDSSLAGVCVFFPDPWPKARHEKNRLVRKEFFEILSKKLAPKGFLWFKTDHEPYFEYATEAARECGWRLSERDAQPELLGQSSYVTVFEQMFMSRSEPLYRVVLTPPGQNLKE